MILTMDQIWTLIFCGWLYGLMSALFVMVLLLKWGWIKPGRGR